jgi:hypothetical protein
MDRPSRDVEGSDPLVSVEHGNYDPATALTEAHAARSPTQLQITEAHAASPAQLQILSDSPAEKDELGRGSYVEAFARVITSADTPLVIAIYGAWGTGKTSFMKQLQDRLTQPDALGHVTRTVWFDPWMHQSDEIPVLGLLHETAKELGQEMKQRAKEALINIGRAMVSELRVPVVGLRVGRVLEEVAAGVYEQRAQQARLRHYFEVVLDAAGRKDGRLVFFIDDLDRCRPATALRLLEALQLFLNFKNCIFVLGLDREPVEAAIAAEYRDLGLRAESFLDKIIQLPFTLPPLPESVVNSFVASRVPDQLKACRPLLSAAAPDDPRQLKRTINVLVLSHYLVDTTSFEQGYDPRILAVVVLIQNLAPALYRILRIRPAAIHEVLTAESRESSQASTDSVTQVEPSELWVKYVAPAPGLAQALRHVPDTADLDIGPYLKLTSAVTMSDAVSLSYRSAITLWSILSAGAHDLDSILTRVLDPSNHGIHLTAATRRAQVGQMKDTIADLLNVDLSELILEGWRKRSEVVGAMTRTSGGRASAERIDLAAQQIQIILEPTVDLLVDGKRVANIHVTVRVTCDIGPSVIVVRNGLIARATGENDAHVLLMIEDAEVATAQRRVELADLFG